MKYLVLLSVLLSGCSSATIVDRQEAQTLIQSVASDYPLKSFNVSLDRPYYAYEYDGTITATIPVTVSWKQEYLDRFEKAISSTAQSNGFDYCKDWEVKFIHERCITMTYLEIISPKWMGGTTISGYRDSVNLKIVYKAMILSSPQVLLTVRGRSNKIIHNQCYQWMELDHDQNTRPIGNAFVNVRNNILQVDGRIVLRSGITLDGTKIPLVDITETTARVVPQSMCPK
jgi:hypothetical protein